MPNLKKNKKQMKKISLICLLAIVFCSCRENLLVDPTVLPPVTKEGKHTFGCLIDNWAYVGGRYHDISSVVMHNDQHSIVFHYNEISKYMDVRVKIDGNTNPDKYLKFRISGVEGGVKNQECLLENARFSITRDSSGDETPFENRGVVKITNFVSDSLIVSGIFYGTDTKKITEGRFDVQYIKD